MKVIEEIPHPVMKISIMSWNQKYIVKIEAKNYEQTFKVKESDVSGGLADVKKMLDDEFLNVVAENFKRMHTTFVDTYNKNVL